MRQLKTISINPCPWESSSTSSMQSLNIDAARKHGLELGGSTAPVTSGTPISLNTPDILNTLISITSNPFFEPNVGVTSSTGDYQNGTGDEDKKVFATLEAPAPPQSTVQSMRSHLIKEGLKFRIQSKRKSCGLGIDDLKAETEVKRKKDELTPEDEERRKRRRERNKIAATKCRNKKKEKTYLLVQESESLEDNNIILKTEISKLECERQRLVEVLAAHAPNCKQNMNSAYSDFNHSKNNYYDQTIQL